jgi:hypothetical protein
MKKYLLFFFAILLSGSSSGGEDIVKKETIRRNVTLGEPASARTIVVDNVFGSVEVKGVAGNEVRIVAEKTIRAESGEELAKAQADVRLDVTEEKDGLRIAVDGPFRKEDGSVHFHGRDRGGYSFSYDFLIEAPRNAKIDVSTVNDGDITVSGMRGDFDVENVNGGIEMVDMEGSGRAYALNEDLTVAFARNPERHCYFGSLNGKVKIAFRSPLSADLRFKTFNGEVFSDFPVTYLPRKGLVEKGTKKGKTTYKTDPWTPVRVGEGGPSIDLDGFNGNMYVLKNQNNRLTDIGKE